MPHVTVNGVDLYYERAGTGPRLLFIAGTGADLRVKPNVFDSVLAGQFDILAYDQRGLGRSEKPERDSTMADYADDAAALMDAVGWTDALVLGISFGGMVAQELVLRYPERVKRVVMACSSPGGAGGASYPLHEIAHLVGADRARHMIPVSDTRRDAAWQAANPEVHAALIAQMADAYADEPGREEGLRRQLATRATHDTWDRLPQIRCPVMIAAGRYDGNALPATQERLAAQIPGAELHWFEGGHMFMMQEPAAYPAMAAFLKG